MIKHLKKYKNKRVFLTGHTGFKGGWMVALLHELGAIVKGYALVSENSQGIYQTINGDKLCQSEINDIRNKSQLESSILDFAPDFIFHLAAQPLVRLSYLSPSETFEINTLGTSYLLEAALKLNKKCSIIIITTDKVYENHEIDCLYSETDTLGGHDPYSTSKACAELVATSFNKSYLIGKELGKFISISTARAGNVIGGGDYSQDRIMPDLVRAITNKKEIVLRNPMAIRPWQHVLEPIVGYLLLGLRKYFENDNLSSTFNFGPKEENHLQVQDLIIQAIGYWGDGKYVVKQDSKLHEATLLKLDIKRAQEELGWIPHYTALESLKMAIDWYRSENKNEITFSQIRGYLNNE